MTIAADASMMLNPVALFMEADPQRQAALNATLAFFARY